jgi:hypothetical protein
VSPASQVERICLAIARGGAIEHLALGRTQSDLERGDDALRDFGLDVEQILQCSIETLCPDRVAIGRPHQLGADPRPCSGAAHAALHQIGDAELAPHGTRRQAALAIRQHLATCGNLKPRQARQIDDQVLGEAGGEKLVVGFGAQRLEVEHGQSWRLRSFPGRLAPRSGQVRQHVFRARVTTRGIFGEQSRDHAIQPRLHRGIARGR